MPSKLRPYDAFNDNMADAESLLRYAVAFKNQRLRRMRPELRDSIGKALKIPQGERDELDRLQSKDLFVVFTPRSNLTRQDFTDLRPLLRQSIVAACAALETYVADKAMDFVGSIISVNAPPTGGLKDIQLTVADWHYIERTYERRGWGIRRIVQEHIRKTSSTAPSQIGQVLALIGVQRWTRQLDSIRKVSRGTTEAELKEITKRRNSIAHTADRKGHGRASLQVEEVDLHLQRVRSIVDAIETLLDPKKT